MTLDLTALVLAFSTSHSPAVQARIDALRGPKEPAYKLELVNTYTPDLPTHPPKVDGFKTVLTFKF